MSFSLGFSTANGQFHIAFALLSNNDISQSALQNNMLITIIHGKVKLLFLNDRTVAIQFCRENIPF